MPKTDSERSTTYKQNKLTLFDMDEDKEFYQRKIREQCNKSQQNRRGKKKENNYQVDQQDPLTTVAAAASVATSVAKYQAPTDGAMQQHCFRQKKGRKDSSSWCFRSY